MFDAAEDMDADLNWEDPLHNNLCMLSHKLMKEMKLGEDSEFAPYIVYLQAQKPGQLPANCSKAGKDMLRQVLRPGSAVVDRIDWNFQKKGCTSGDGPFEKQGGNDSAAMLQYCSNSSLGQVSHTMVVPMLKMIPCMPNMKEGSRLDRLKKFKIFASYVRLVC